MFIAAQNDLIILVHQDVFLPEGWDDELREQLEEAKRQFGPIGVAGVYGVGPAIEQNRTSPPSESAGSSIAGACFANGRRCPQGLQRSTNCS